MGEDGNYGHSWEEPRPGCVLHLKAVGSALILRWSLDLFKDVGNQVPYMQELLVGGNALVDFMGELKSLPW